MTVYRDTEGNSFEMPKLTVKLAEEMENVPTGKSFTAISKAMYEFVKKILPDDYLNETLQGDKLDDLDIVALRNVYDNINNAYTDALHAGTYANINKQLEEVAPMLDSVDKMMAIQKQTPSRQGFNRVA